MSTYLEQLSPEEAMTVLRHLAKEDREMAIRIERLAKAVISDVEEAGITDDVYQALISIDIEGLWNRPSGSKRFRYKEPVEAAYEMVEEALQPFGDLLKKYRKLAMYSEVKIVGLGIAKGILKFTSDGQTEFKQWAPDDALEWLGGMLIDWERECANISEEECIREIKKLIGE